jgi:Flp pilus assembly protein TadD
MGTGLLAERAGDAAFAVNQFSHASKFAPSDVGMLLLSGALRRSGKNSEADAAYEKAQKLSDNFPRAEEAATQLASSFGLNSY